MNQSFSEISVCPVCSENKKIILKDKILNIFYCPFCSHTFTLIPENQQEEYRDNYFTEEHKNWFAHPNTSLYNFIRSKIENNFPDKTVKVLDVGCGNGSFLNYLKSKNKKYDLNGIDLNKNETEGINFYQGDFFGYSTDKKFNAIVTLGTIEHIAHPNLFIQKTSSHLKQEGIIVIMTINNNSLIYFLARIFKRIGFSSAYNRLYSSHHFQHFSNKSLKKLLWNNDFEIIFHKNHNYPVQAVDVPAKNLILRFLFVTVVGFLFLLSFPLGLGQLQTVICKKQQ